jgi:hypothetical protein
MPKKNKYEALAIKFLKAAKSVARTRVPEITAIQRCPHGRKKPKIEIEGIWSDGEVHGKRCVSLCSTGVAMLYLQGQRHKACKAKLWLVRFFVNGKLVREWDEINQKYHLEVA